jgi:hypothetical protein
MLVAKTPVSNRPSSITITPSPGTVRRNWIDACAVTGSTICEPLSSQRNTPSSRPSTACRTQIVTASGSQTSRPAMR